MPIGTTQNVAGVPPTGTGGEWRFPWVVGCTDTRTAQSAAELLNPTSVDDSTCQPINIPQGATRFIARLRVPAAVTTYTTSPVIRFVGLSIPCSAGTENTTASIAAPLRLDNVDSSADGVTITGTSSDLVCSDASERSDPTNLVGYPTCGCSVLYVLVQTASNYTDGASSQAVPCEVIFMS